MKRFKKYSLVRSFPKDTTSFIKPIFHIQLNNAKVIKVQNQSKGHSSVLLQPNKVSEKSESKDLLTQNEKEKSAYASSPSVSNVSSQPTNVSLTQTQPQKTHSTNYEQQKAYAYTQKNSKQEKEEALNDFFQGSDQTTNENAKSNSIPPPDNPPGGNPIPNVLNRQRSENEQAVINQSLNNLQNLSNMQNDQTMQSVQSEPSLQRTSTIRPNLLSNSKPTVNNVSPIKSQATDATANNVTDMSVDGSMSNTLTPSLADATNNSSLQSTFSTANQSRSVADATKGSLDSTVLNQTTPMNISEYDSSQYTDIPSNYLKNITIQPHATTKELIDSLPTLSPSQTTFKARRNIFQNQGARPKEQLIDNVKKIIQSTPVKKNTNIDPIDLSRITTVRPRSKSVSVLKPTKLQNSQNSQVSKPQASTQNSSAGTYIDVTGISTPTTSNSTDDSQAFNMTNQKTILQKPSTFSDNLTYEQQETRPLQEHLPNNQENVVVNNNALNGSLPTQPLQSTENNSNVTRPRFPLSSITSPTKLNILSDTSGSNILPQPLHSTENNSNVNNPHFPMSTLNVTEKDRTALSVLPQPLHSTGNSSNVNNPEFPMSTLNVADGHQTDSTAVVQDTSASNSFLNETTKPLDSEERNTFSTGHITESTAPLEASNNTTITNSNDDVFLTNSPSSKLSGSYGIKSQTPQDKSTIKGLNQIEAITNNKLKRGSTDLSETFFDPTKAPPIKTHVGSKPKSNKFPSIGTKRSISDVTLNNQDISPKRKKRNTVDTLKNLSQLVVDKLKWKNAN